MDPRQLRSARSATPQFVKPILNTLDTLRGRERARPAQLNLEAEELLWSTFGREGGAPEVAFAHASLEVMAEHVHYFDGFALLMPMAEGSSVAVRRAKAETRVVVRAEEGGPSQQRVEGWIKEIAGQLIPPSEGPVEISVVCNVPALVGTASRVSVQVAAARAIAALRALETSPEGQLDTLPQFSGAGRWHGRAMRLAGAANEPVGFVLVDTRMGEAIDLDVPPVERPGFMVVATGEPKWEVDRSALQVVESEIVYLINASGTIAPIQSLRDVVHRDLDRILAVLPRKLKPFLNYAVTENGRVQKLVAAIQRRDWQMFGALLFMAHASRRTDLGLADARCDFVVSQVENMSLDGMYGATRLGADVQAVLVAGQPFSVPPALETLRASFEEHYREPITTLLL